MGFDNECILNIQSLPGEYFCPVCRLLVYPNEAIQSQCTHLYCKPCLTYIVSTTRACPYDGYLVTEADSKPLLESNKTVAETIGKIGVHCLYHRSGCTWQGSLTDCTTHCLGCSFGNSPVVCNRCGIQIVHRQVQEHAQNCAGMQQPIQHVQGTQEGMNTANAVAAEQNHASKGGEIISQPQNTTAPSAQNSNQLSSHSQAVGQSSATHDQWYQQQRYMQYCQQYPGYDPYQQYYPHQQPVQSYQQQNIQAQAAVNPGQLQFPAHGPPPSQLQVQQQAQFQPQPPQMQSHALGQSSFHTQASIPVQHQTSAPSNQHQLYSTMQPSQNTVPANTMTAIQSTHSQPYPQTQPLPQSQGPQNPQIVQYHQPQHSMNYPLPTVQAHPPSLSIPQHHSLPQYQPSSQLTQQPLQAHSAHRPVMQPNQAANHTVQPQAQAHPQHPSSQAVTGHNSYPHSHPYQHHAGGIQHPSHVLSAQTGGYVQSQHPLPVQSQIPHPSSQLQSSTSGFLQNQLQSNTLSTTATAPSVPPPSQQHGYSHTQQHQVMQSMPQSFPSHMVHQPTVTGQSSGIGPNLSHPRAHFPQHQGPVPSSRPSGPLQAPQHSVQQMAHSGTMSQGRHVGPNLSSQSQSLAQSNGSQNLLQPGHVQFQSGSSVGPPNYSSRTNSAGRAELQSVHIQRSTSGYSPKKYSSTSDVKGDHILEKSSSGKMIDGASQNACKKETGSALDTSCSEAEVVGIVTVTSDTSNKVVDDTIISGEEGQPLKSETKDMEPSHVQNEPEAEVTDSAKSPIRELKHEKASDFSEENAVDIVPHTSHGNFDVLNDQKDASGMDSKRAEVTSSGNLDTADPSLTGVDPDQQTGAVKENLKPLIDNNSSAACVSAAPVFDYARNLTQSLATSYAEPSNGGEGLEQFSGPLPHDSSRRPHSMNPSSYSSVVTSEKPSLFHSSTFPVPNHAHIQGHSLHVRPLFQSDLGFQAAPVFPRDHFHAPHQKQSHGSFHMNAPHAGYGAAGSAALHGKGPEQIGSDSQTFDPVSVGPRYNTQAHQPPHHVGGYFHPRPTGHRRLDRVDSLHNYPAWPSSCAPSHTMEMDVALPNSHISGMGVERLRHQHEEKATTFSSHPIFDRKEFDEPRKFHSLPYDDFRPDEKGRNFISSLKPFDHRALHGSGIDHPILPFDKGMHCTNYDGRSNFDADANIAPSKFFPPFSSGRVFPDDKRESEMTETRNEIFGRRDVHSQADSLNSSGVSRNMDDDYCFGGSPRFPSRVYGVFSGFCGSTFGVDTADRREFNPFSDPLGSTGLLPRQSGSSFPESGFSFRPSLLNKVEFERFGAHDSLKPGLGSIGNVDNRSDILPSCGDYLGPRNITGKWHMGEFTDVGGIQNNAQLGQFSGAGRFGESGFGSSHSLQKYQCDGGLFVDPTENDNSSMRKAPGLGWCRICCVECTTLEGLEMHSQTRDHQKAAMDIVLSIKKQIAWKSRNASDENSFDKTDKHAMAGLDPLGNA